MNQPTRPRFDGVLWGAAAVLLVAALAGCGGGLQLGIGTNSNDPPSVTLVAGAASGVRGNALVLFADASDDDAVARVVFHRVNDDNSSTELGTDSSRPYSLEVTLPDAATITGTSVRYFARAVDSDDETTDSATVSVTLVD
jgi:Bacterial Ig domain